jgi:hypothetical protein
MTWNYTIPTEIGREQLQRISALVDVKHVAILDAVGLCLIHSGHEPVSTMLLTGWTVVARAAFSACDDLGQRCGCGPCQESLQTHAEGGTLMRSMRGGMLLVIQFGRKTPIGTLRIAAMEVCEALPIANEVRPRPVRLPEPIPTNDPFANSWPSQATPLKQSRGLVFEAEKS